MQKQVILCIDDEEIILQALEEQLKNFFGDEYDIEISDSGPDAIEFFKELKAEGIKIPVVISDYIMPGMKGDEVLKQIHEMAPKSLKILLTGHADVEGISNAINNAKLYRYIAKPWDKEDLVLTVREAIKSFLQEIEIRRQNEELLELNASLEEKVKERTSELSIANASKDKFFSIIAHDLKNPFNALLGFTDLLIEDWDLIDEETKLSVIKDLRKSSKNTYSLLKNLLEWSRSQTGRITIEPVALKTSELVTETMNVLMNQAEIKEIKLVNTIPHNNVCFADNNMISTVFRNLISNAIKFTCTGGMVKIHAIDSGSNYTYCIEDNGVGMDNETVSKLFQITEKIKTLGTAKEEGTGLGLILCKEFIEKNGGTLVVESELNVGSKFCFTLPKG